jgi:hypothetical protein
MKTCEKCGSKKLKYAGNDSTSGINKEMYQCQDCGHITFFLADGVSKGDIKNKGDFMLQEEIKKLNNADLVGQLISHAHTFGDFVQETKDFSDEIIRRLGNLIRQKTADIGITEQPEKPEDMPKTITVLTQDFIQLIMIAGSLCHPEAKPIYKQRMEGDIRKIALRHHINYVGEIKE